MNDISEYLAAAYGNPGAGAVDGDLEKQAALELLEQVARENQIDLSDIDFTNETAESIKEAIDGLTKTASAEPENPIAGFEDADTAGRVMAHAFWQEHTKIAAVHEGKGGSKRDFLSAAEAAKAKVMGRGSKAGLGRFGSTKAAPSSAAVGDAAAEKAMTLGQRGSRFYRGTIRPGAEKALAHLRGNKGRYGAAAALLGAGAAGGFALSRRKQSSAIDELAAQRLEEWLEEQGRDKQASLEDAVNQRAYEMAVELGYIAD